MSDAEDSAKYYGVAAAPSNPINSIDRDTVKKMAEEIKRMEYARKSGRQLYTQDGDTMIPNKSRTISIREYEELSKQKNYIKDNIIAQQKSLEAIEQLESKLENLPFKIGSAGFVKHLGNVIITGIEVDENNTDNIFYVTIGTTGSRVIPAAEMLPINETTKVLYGNK